MTSTIFALASGAGAAGVAVIRVSGPASHAALVGMTGGCPEARHATVAAVRHPASGEILDRGLVLWFPGPHSFTGEDGAEFHVHGSRAVVAALLDALGQIPGCRLAEPGEFTRRAFDNGKLDLDAVERLADLIDAQTESQRRQALHYRRDALGDWVGALRDDLLRAQALAEAAIDFADEGDVAADALAQARHAAAAALTRIDAERSAGRAAERIRDGVTVAIAGPPNAGKSTLLNALARRDVAIVSPIPGTTRDPIEVDLDLGGFAVRLIDTAGLHAATDPLENAGILRTRARAAAADLVLWLQDAAATPAVPSDLGPAPLWCIGTKLDAATVPPAAGFDLCLSALTGAHMDGLPSRLTAWVSAQVSGGETAVVTRARHRHVLDTVAAQLARVAEARRDAELVAEDLRAAAAALGTVTERIGAEDVLGSIFARFCIGK